MPCNRWKHQALACSSLQRLRCMTKRGCISVLAFEFGRERQSHVGFQPFLSAVDIRDQRTTGRLLRPIAPAEMGAVRRASACRREWCNEAILHWDGSSTEVSDCVTQQANVCSSAPSVVKIERSCVVPVLEAEVSPCGGADACLASDGSLAQSKADIRDQRTTGRLLRPTAPAELGAVRRASACRREWCNEAILHWDGSSKDVSDCVTQQARVCGSAPPVVKVERRCVVPVLQGGVSPSGGADACLANRNESAEQTRDWMLPQKGLSALSVLVADAVQLQAKVCSSAPSVVEIERRCVVPVLEGEVSPSGGADACLASDGSLAQSEGSAATGTLARLFNGSVASIGS
ncbi:uncharacterized protein EMH_0071150 [Eimeria mitis]|uniref:Uncharacterized protein n=1 Tax=Eimeria mitis TaxID=44415 RepID=U6K2R3_9EIME|nr:uncharacterized protein EMH_0071150 [Eimeria mitis]CDJ31954.1 hypothetical protein EMH_0071150 [Eimeria mitis]